MGTNGECFRKETGILKNAEERRRNVRVIFRTSVSVTETGEGARTVSVEKEGTRDISLQGLYVLTSEPFPAGTECMVNLRLTGSSSDLQLDILGTVVRTDDTGMAIKFESMDIDALIHLKNILYYNSGDPERIDAELSGNTIVAL